MNKHLRILLISLWLAPVGLFAQSRDTLTYTVKAAGPVEFEESSEERPTQHLDDEGRVINKSVHKTYAVYHDTLYSIITEHDTLYVPNTTTTSDTTYNHNGSQFHFYIGGGYGSLGYKIGNKGTVTGAPAAIVQLQYAYIFGEHWGIGLGVSFTNSTSVVRLKGSYQWNGVTDSDGEIYNHTTDVYDWRERETVHTLGVPLSLQYQTYFGEKKTGLYWDLGASANLNLYNRYNIKKGDIEDRGYYPATHLTLEQLHEFQRRDMAGKGKMDVSLMSVGVFADLGLLFRVSEKTDIALGLYGMYSALDINRTERHALGFANADFPFMEPYRGAFSLNDATAARPWEAGLKFGVRVHAQKMKVDDYENFELKEQYVEHKDTVVNIIIRRETIEASKLPKKEESLFPAAVQMAAAELAAERAAEEEARAEALRKQQEVVKGQRNRSRDGYGTQTAKNYDYHIIYFEFDKYSLSPEAKDYLDEIIAYMNEHPEKHVAVSGHACEIGSASYNMRLSRERAVSVVDYLEDHGIDRRRIVFKYYGKNVPSEKGAHNLSKDRRVIVKVSKD
ncbi:MAG: OmpA family protein [Paludibacteraceae bacterium]|nr:OmpA family protein [Paludibacteraceae bacterium]